MSKKVKHYSLAFGICIFIVDACLDIEKCQ